MSTRIEIKYVCDHCKADDLTKDEIKSFLVTSKALGKAEYEFDLCSKCSVDFQSDYLPFKKGNPVFETPVACTYPECTYIGPNARSLGHHKGAAHPGFIQQERMEQAASKGVPCTEEGCDFVALNAQGLNLHLKQARKHKKVKV